MSGIPDARAQALALLARREHSREELRRKLTHGGHADTVVDEVLSQLANDHLQSERRFAEEYLRVRAARGYGPVRIGAELRQRGIDDATIADALAAVAQDWPARLAEARRKRFGGALPGDARERLRQCRFLEYRGFTPVQIRALIGGDA
ncbi:MAG: regulatory protein RecX [Gammaproteobacteria bacterium]